MSPSSVFIGVDVGTQGVRTMAFNEQGDLLANSSQVFGFSDWRVEQSTSTWWNHLLDGLRDVAAQLRGLGSLHRVTALSVTSTSGTVIPLNRHYEALSPALMYSDERAIEQAQTCRQAAIGVHAGGYQDFNASSGLPKICWFVDTYPDKVEEIYLWAHAVDYLVGRLSGVWGISDYTSVLKTGYNLETLEWPSYLQERLLLPREWFPDVVPSGTSVGRLAPDVVRATGLPGDVAVMAGMTDGCASQIAAGAVAPGDWNTTIGTTLVVKGVSREKVVDPRRSFYNHKHPEGYWMPGGASNTGADWITVGYSGVDLQELNRSARSLSPTRLLTWPLLQHGERFPFLSPEAKGFYPEGISTELRYASSLEGVAFIERLSYERVRDLTGQSLTQVFAAGGASRSVEWMQIRSNVLGVPMVKMRHTEGAAGAAIVAASGSGYTTLQQAAEQMLQIQVLLTPERQDKDIYDETYEAFVNELECRGFLG